MQYIDIMDSEKAKDFSELTSDYKDPKAFIEWANSKFHEFSYGGYETGPNGQGFGSSEYGTVGRDYYPCVVAYNEPRMIDFMNSLSKMIEDNPDLLNLVCVVPIPISFVKSDTDECAQTECIYIPENHSTFFALISELEEYYISKYGLVLKNYLEYFAPSVQSESEYTIYPMMKAFLHSEEKNVLIYPSAFCRNVVHKQGLHDPTYSFEIIENSNIMSKFKFLDLLKIKKDL
jgi:hypothetical protein